MQFRAHSGHTLGTPWAHYGFTMGTPWVHHGHTLGRAFWYASTHWPQCLLIFTLKSSQRFAPSHFIHHPASRWSSSSSCSSSWYDFTSPPVIPVLVSLRIMRTSMTVGRKLNFQNDNDTDKTWNFMIPSYSRSCPGILVIGGESSTFGSQSVEFWSAANPEGGSCVLSDYPREMRCTLVRLTLLTLFTPFTLFNLSNLFTLFTKFILFTLFTQVHPDCKPCLRSTGCLLRWHLWDLHQWRVEPLGAYQVKKEIPQQRTKQRQNPPHRRMGLKKHRVDPGGRFTFPTRTVRCEARIPPLHHSTIRRPDSGDWGVQDIWLCNRIPADWERKRDSSNFDATRQAWSRLCCLPGCSRTTGDHCLGLCHCHCLCLCHTPVLFTRM